MSPRKSETVRHAEESLHESMPREEIDAGLQHQFDDALAGYCQVLIERKDQKALIHTADRLTVIACAKTMFYQTEPQTTSVRLSWIHTVRDGLEEYARQCPEYHDTIKRSAFFSLEGDDSARQARRAAGKILPPRPKSKEELIQGVARGIVRIKEPEQ